MRFKLINFKSFIDTDWVEIKPITLFIGKNGSGKTALVQPLLLLSQTLESADESISLMTKGPYVNTGTFKDIVYNHKIDQKFEFKFRLDEPKKNEKRSTIGKFAPSSINLSFVRGKDSMPKLKEIVLSDKYDRQMLKRTLLNSGRYSIRLYRGINEIPKREKKYKEILKNQQPKHFLFDDREIWRERIMSERIRSKEKPIKIEFSRVISEYLMVTSFARMRLENLLESIKYIGPLREFPRRFYEYRGEKHPEVGTKGEYTYSLLFKLLKQAGKKKEIEKWLRKFELADKISCKTIKQRPDLIEINVTPNKSNLIINYADACIGISQILPILVQTMMSENKDIIFTEQPELHLNPYCETILADFFVEAVKKYKCSFLVETHSEHYFMRLRTHIKRGLISNEDVAVYYIERDEGNSIIRKIELDKMGGFKNKNWPVGFFEQSLTESLMYATAKITKK